MNEAPDIPEARDKGLNQTVAATVVALSVLMALGNIKDGNIVQDMQAAQVTQIDTIAALAETWWLLYFGWGAAGLALLLSVAGFAQLPVHPDAIIGFLT